MEHSPATVEETSQFEDSTDIVLEERHLAEVSPEAMTLEQSQRILFLWNRRALVPSPYPTRRTQLIESLGLLYFEDLIDNRDQCLDRALMNIPPRLMVTWSLPQIWKHYSTFVQWLVSDRVFLRDARIEFEAQADQLNGNVELRTTSQADLVFLENMFVEVTIRRTAIYHQAYASTIAPRSATIHALLQHIPISTNPGGDRTCSICKLDYPTAETPDAESEESDSPVSLPCGHIFGSNCITVWLREQDSCPICRRDYRAELNNNDEGEFLRWYDDGGHDEADQDDGFDFDPNADPNAIVFYLPVDAVPLTLEPRPAP